jgi:hypothetical protein
MDNYRAFLQTAGCTLADSTDDKNLSYTCPRGHIKRMALTSFGNLVAKVKKGEKPLCSDCAAFDRAAVDVARHGHILTEYKNVADITFQCGSCGAETHGNMGNIRKPGVRPNCSRCIGRGKTASEAVAAQLAEFGFKLTRYENNKSVLAVCRCGEEVRMALNDIKRGRGCISCAGARRAETNLERYGAENPFAAVEIKERIKATHMERRGVDHHMKAPESLSKAKKTCMDKYGVEYAFTQDWVYAKIRKTHIRLHGVPYPLQSAAIQARIEEVFTAKYGARRPFMAPDFVEKLKRMMLEKYGVEYAMQNPDIFRKALASSFRKKEYTFPSGKVVHVLGYEPLALDFLLLTYDEKEIEVEHIAPINYTLNGKQRIYHPDIWISSTNTIIEVKSYYTLTLEQEKNNAKFKAVYEAGFVMRLLVFSGGALAEDVIIGQ